MCAELNSRKNLIIAALIRTQIQVWSGDPDTKLASVTRWGLKSSGPENLKIQSKLSQKTLFRLSTWFTMCIHNWWCCYPWTKQGLCVKGHTYLSWSGGCQKGGFFTIWPKAHFLHQVESLRRGISSAHENNFPHFRKRLYTCGPGFLRLSCSTQAYIVRSFQPQFSSCQFWGLVPVSGKQSFISHLCISYWLQIHVLNLAPQGQSAFTGSCEISFSPCTSF